MFWGSWLSVSMWSAPEGFPEIAGIFGASLMVMAVGIKDDILAIHPLKKLAGICISAVMVILFAGLRITSFQGAFGIHGLPTWLSEGFTFIIIVFVVNAFNLIDGIDGLAAGLGILASVAYGIWFQWMGDNAFAILSWSLAGALLAFFWFNVFGGRRKIFLGDSGSLFTGLLLSIISIRFCELNIANGAVRSLETAPAIAIAFVGVPVFDTIRVFMLRIARRQSPFRADKNHIHHKLLSLRLSHLESNAVLLILNLCLVLIAVFLRSLNIVILTGLMFLTFTLFTLVVGQLQKRDIRIGSGNRVLHESRIASIFSALFR
ncbi:MAG: hypothetical protein CSA96_05170, partial [Bacteroidetes bacterium]